MIAGRSAAWLAGTLLALMVCAPSWALAPRINYMLQCQGCHGPDGRGEPGHVPAIRATLVPLASLPDGRRYLVQVPGVAQSTLSDPELAALLNWTIETLGRVTPERFAAFTPAEVARYRHEPLVEVSATRARLMRKLR